MLTSRSGRAVLAGALPARHGVLPALPLVPIPAQPARRPRTGCPRGLDLDALGQLVLHRGVPAAVTFAFADSGNKMTGMRTHKPAATRWAQLAAGIRAIFRSLLIASSSGLPRRPDRSPGRSSSSPAIWLAGRAWRLL